MGWKCNSCALYWTYDHHTVNGISCPYCGSYRVSEDNMQKPQAIKGRAAAVAPVRMGGKGEITQVGPTIFQVQGSAAKPYNIDMEGRDDRAGKTPMCTCPNWKLERNKIVSLTGTFTGYDCKHIRAVRNGMGTQTIDMSQERAAQIKAEILATFVKKAK